MTQMKMPIEQHTDIGPKTQGKILSQISLYCLSHSLHHIIGQFTTVDSKGDQTTTQRRMSHPRIVGATLWRNQQSKSNTDNHH